PKAPGRAGRAEVSSIATKALGRHVKRELLTVVANGALAFFENVQLFGLNSIRDWSLDIPSPDRISFDPTCYQQRRSAREQFEGWNPFGILVLASVSPLDRILASGIIRPRPMLANTSPPGNAPQSCARIDVLTVAAIGVLAYFVAGLVHEGAHAVTGV